MSILSLPRHRAKHGPGEAALSAAAVHPPQRRDTAPAPYLSHRLDRDRPLLFGDIDADGPAEMPPGWTPARGADQLDHDAVRDAVDALIAESAPVAPLHPDVLLFDALDSLDRLRELARTADNGALALAENLAVIQTCLWMRPQLRHEPALLMALAPIAAMLKAVA